MPIPTAVRKARDSADRRLARQQAELMTAYQLDVREGPEFRQRHQWRVVTGWLMSEAKSASDEQRAEILAHLIKLCQDMNAVSRDVR